MTIELCADRCQETVARARITSGLAFVNLRARIELGCEVITVASGLRDFGPAFGITECRFSGKRMPFRIVAWDNCRRIF